MCRWSFGPVAVSVWLLAATGCQSAVRWEIGTFDDAQKIALQTHRLTFVYFRSWYLVECTQFEDKVLSNPAVRAALDPLVCVPLDFDWDRPLATRWGLTRSPAIAVVDQDRQALAKAEGDMTVQQVLDALSAASANAPTSAAAQDENR